MEKMTISRPGSSLRPPYATPPPSSYDGLRPSYAIPPIIPQTPCTTVLPYTFPVSSPTNSMCVLYSLMHPS
eukprot:467550-Rhodomonas_salina.1